MPLRYNLIYRLTFLAFLISTLLIFNVPKAGSVELLNIGGYFKNEIAYRYVGLKSLTKVKDSLRLDAEMKLTSSIRVASSVKFSYNHVYDISDPNKVNPRRDLRELGIPRIQDISTIAPDGQELIFGVPDEDKQEAQLRELYVDILLENADIRIGKQLVFWGVFDGFRINDNINPISFKEFILKDVDELRIPLWMGRFDYYYGNTNYELLLIPEIKFHESAATGGEFEFFRTLPGDKSPSRSLNNTEWGFKVSGILSSLEWSLNLLSYYDDFPAAFRVLRTDITCSNQAVVPTVMLEPRHPRLVTTGGMLRGTVGRFVLRFEGAHIAGKHLAMEPGVEKCEDLAGKAEELADFNKRLGEKKRNVVKTAVGLDFTLWGSDVAIQAEHENIQGYDGGLMQRDNDVALSVFLRKPIRDEKLIPEMLVLYFVHGAQFLYRPKISYKQSSKISFIAGMDLFTGDEGERPGRLNFIGQFNARDRVYMELKYALGG